MVTLRGADRLHHERGPRDAFARIRRLKPTQIADLLEEASKDERTEIVAQVHADPELEADVFEELDEDLATRLLGARTDAWIARVLARTRADDAADAVAGPPQRRRRPVLDLMPAGQRTKVMTLLGFNPASAGGLMGVEYLALPAGTPVGQALAAAGRSPALQPEALTSIHPRVAVLLKNTSHSKSASMTAPKPPPSHSPKLRKDDQRSRLKRFPQRGA
ncbi:MAG TPA: hypothetical protein VMA97_02580 [Streptosporangiaceae bacterium]|nr:hypothetical protein [Streptosporangiaceae bacterium]